MVVTEFRPFGSPVDAVLLRVLYVFFSRLSTLPNGSLCGSGFSLGSSGRVIQCFIASAFSLCIVIPFALRGTL